MTLKLIYYAFPRCDASLLDDYLVKFKKELSINIEQFSELEIINGNSEFTNTYRFIDSLIEPMNTEIDFDSLCDFLTRVRRNEIQLIRDVYPQAYGFFASNKNIDTNIISQSLETKTLICLEKSGLKFKEHTGAHGLSGRRYAVTIKLYKNIVWHEVAHLFGADEHYVKNDKYKMKEKCTNKELCVMRYDPGIKLCSFCSTAQEEIRNGVFKPNNILGI